MLAHVDNIGDTRIAVSRATLVYTPLVIRIRNDVSRKSNLLLHSERKLWEALLFPSTKSIYTHTVRDCDTSAKLPPTSPLSQPANHIEKFAGIATSYRSGREREGERASHLFSCGAQRTPTTFSSVSQEITESGHKKQKHHSREV